MGQQKHSENSLGINPDTLGGEGSLRGQLLIAMPNIQSGAFSKSVVYICAHNHSGAMGIIINQKLADVEFADLLSQLHLPLKHGISMPVVHVGGPVETGRGFVLHSHEYAKPDTLKISDKLSMTGTVDVLRAIAQGRGPQRSLFALGYAGWSAGELENELQSNSWLTVQADEDILFHPDLEQKWLLSLTRLGVDPALLSDQAGHA